MLRRPATLIPLTSSDIQELRELSEEQKAEALAVRTRLGHLMGVVEQPNLTVKDMELMKEISAAARKKEASEQASSSNSSTLVFCAHCPVLIHA